MNASCVEAYFIFGKSPAWTFEEEEEEEEEKGVAARRKSPIRRIAGF